MFGGVFLKLPHRFDTWRYGRVDTFEQLNTIVYAAKKARQ